MKKKQLIGSIAFVLLVVIGVSMVSAERLKTFDIDFSESKEAIRTAIMDQDYETWRDLKENKIEDMQNRLTREDFELLVARHEEKHRFKRAMEELKASGDFSRDDIEQLRNEFGVDIGNMRNKSDRNIERKRLNQKAMGNQFMECQNIE